MTLYGIEARDCETGAWGRTMVISDIEVVKDDLESAEALIAEQLPQLRRDCGRFNIEVTMIVDLSDPLGEVPVLYRKED